MNDIKILLLRQLVFVHGNGPTEINLILQAPGGGGWGYLGQVLLGMCCWPLRTPIPL